LLLDTHVLLWWLADSPKLGSAAAGLIDDPANSVFVSAATGWEIAIKRASGKLRVREGLHDLVTDEGFAHLPVTFLHGEHAGALPAHHRDPFDRMLIAQAQMEELELLTADRKMRLYSVPCVSAND
jgi:PIN domain nuclease of toxin-antitoxin system